MNVYELLQDFARRARFDGRPLKEHDAVAAVLADLAARSAR